MTMDARVRSLLLKKSKKVLVELLMATREHERSRASKRELDECLAQKHKLEGETFRLQAELQLTKADLRRERGIVDALVRKLA